MTIDKTGRFWTGTGPEDLRAYLVACTADGDPAEAIEILRCGCGCGGAVFGHAADEVEGAATGLCRACGATLHIHDSERALAEPGADAALEAWRCFCGAEDCNLAVGLSLHPAAPGQAERQPSRVTVALRCTGCGTLGSFVEWET